MKKELTKWLNFKVTHYLFLLLSIIFADWFIFEKNYFFLVMCIFTLICSIVISQNKFLILLIFTISIFIFIFISQQHKTKFENLQEIQGTAKIIEVKSNYYIMKWKGDLFYLQKKEGLNFIVGESFKFHAKISELEKTANYYEFDFTDYLNKKFVFYEIEIDKCNSIVNSSLKYHLNNFIDKIAFSDLSNLLWFSKMNSSNEVYSKMVDNNLAYLRNGPIFLIVPLMYWLNNKKKKYKKLKYLQVCILVFFVMFSLVYDNSILIYRIIIFWALKISFKNKSNRLLNIQCLIILIIVKPDYVFSLGFLYLIFIFTFIAYLPSYNQNNKLMVGIGFYTMFLILQGYVNHSVTFTSSIYAFLLLPIVNIYAFVSIISDIFHLNISLALTNSLEIIFSFAQKLSLSLNTGYFGIWFALLWTGCFLRLTYVNSMNVKFALFILVVLAMSCLLLFLMKPSANLVMLNVGNANAFVYHDKWQNTTIIFDAGTGVGKSKELVSSYLTYIGVNKIDAVFISHFDSDHYNNFFDIQSKFKINQVITNENFVNSYKIKNVFIQVFQNFSPSSDNDSSLVIFMDVGNFRALFMGDAEIKTELNLMSRNDFLSYLKLKPVNFMQIGHHGSKTSSSKAFLELVNPLNAFISGTYEGGNKNFPHEQTIQSLKSLNINFFITKSVNNWFYFIGNGKIAKK